MSSYSFIAAILNKKNRTKTFKFNKKELILFSNKKQIQD